MRPLFSQALAALVAAATVGLLAITLPPRPTPRTHSTSRVEWTNVHINEVSSDNGLTPVGDAIGLYNR